MALPAVEARLVATTAPQTAEAAGARAAPLAVPGTATTRETGKPEPPVASVMGEMRAPPKLAWTFPTFQRT